VEEAYPWAKCLRPKHSCDELAERQQMTFISETFASNFTAGNECENRSVERDVHWPQISQLHGEQVFLKS
jgi:hypothetical protein